MFLLVIVWKMLFGPCFMCFIYTPKKTVCLKLHLTFSQMYSPQSSQMPSQPFPVSYLESAQGFLHTAFEYFYYHHFRSFQWCRFFFSWYHMRKTASKTPQGSFQCKSVHLEYLKGFVFFAVRLGEAYCWCFWGSDQDCNHLLSLI